MGTGDLAFAYVENTKETAIDIKEALAQPFVLIARWIKDGSKYYYRVPYQASGKSYTYNDKSYGGLDKFGSTVCPATVKYDEPVTILIMSLDVMYLYSVWLKLICFVLKLMDVRGIIMRL